MSARFIVGDVFDVLDTLEPASVDLVLSSPPFLALRSYLPGDHPNKGKEIGSEPTPADFLDTLLDVTEACARVLTPYGSLVFELGDTYAGGGGGPDSSGLVDKGDQHTTLNRMTQLMRANKGAWPLDKSLCGIPTLFAWSLAYGRNLLRPERTTDAWRVRNVVAWCRPNPPVGALGDKFRPGTSYLTVACKARDRWFDLDAVREAHRPDTVEHRERYPQSRYADTGKDANAARADGGKITGVPLNPAGAPPLDWWEIPTQPYKGSHYATWPEKLLVRPIEAMCPREVCTTCGQPRRRITERTAEYAAARKAIGDFNTRDEGQGTSGSRSTLSSAAGRDVTCAENATVGWTDCGHASFRRGVTLDPFAGSGTTLAVAEGLGRDSVGIDLDARNADLAYERCGMFLSVVVGDRLGETA